MSQIKDITFDDFGVTVGKRSTILSKYHNKLEDNFLKYADILDPYQRVIVFEQDINKPARITAGPGSGKTFCLLMKSLKMVIQDGIPPSSLVLFTFTRKAAAEIKERYFNFFAEVLPPEDLAIMESPHISTTHSFGCKLLQIMGYNYSIMSDYQHKGIIKDIMEGLVGKTLRSEATLVHDAIAAMCANGESHFVATPKFDSMGKLEGVQEGYLAEILDQYTYTGLEMRIKGMNKEIDSEGIVNEYAGMANIGIDLYKKVVKEVFKLKYTRHTINFSDMIYVPFLMMLQHREKREQVWDIYKYFLCDEAQDNSTSRSNMMLVADKDTYLAFGGNP